MKTKLVRKKSVIKKKTKRVVKKKSLLKTKVSKKAPAQTQTKQPKQPAAKAVGNYLSNAELLKAVHESKQAGKMSDNLAFKLQLLSSKYARSAKYARYSYNEDMQAYAMMMLVRTWNSFNPARSNNPFAFFTQCIKNSFIQYLNQEKKQRNIRDELLIDTGLNPSFNYQHDYGDEYHNQLHEEKTSEELADRVYSEEESTGVNNEPEH